jgi:dihydroorotate dehydrogenase
VDALGPGGVSGPPVRPRALEVVARIFRRHEGRLPIVGVGGIASSADAWAHLRAGATAVQLYTGLVYGGPGVARAINRGLLVRLEAAGLTSITEVVGLGA